MATNVKINWGPRKGTTNVVESKNVSYTLPHKCFSVLDAVGQTAYSIVRSIGNWLDKPVLWAGSQVYAHKLSSLGATPECLYDNDKVNDGNRDDVHKEMFVQSIICADIWKLMQRADLVTMDAQGKIVINYDEDNIVEALFNRIVGIDNLVDAKTGQPIQDYSILPDKIRETLQSIKAQAETLIRTASSGKADNTGKADKGNSEAQILADFLEQCKKIGRKDYPESFMVNGLTYTPESVGYDATIYVRMYEARQQEPASTQPPLTGNDTGNEFNTKDIASFVNGLMAAVAGMSSLLGQEGVAAVCTMISGIAATYGATVSSGTTTSSADPSTDPSADPSTDPSADMQVSDKEQAVLDKYRGKGKSRRKGSRSSDADPE